MCCCNVECSVPCVAVLQCCMTLIVLHVLHDIVLQCCMCWKVAVLQYYMCWNVDCCRVACAAMLSAACVQFIVLQCCNCCSVECVACVGMLSVACVALLQVLHACVAEC